MLWQIGKPDGRWADVVLAPGEYAWFLQQFGRSNHAYCTGLGKPEIDRPFVLPGPLDTWAGSSACVSWHQMNTRPIGFVLDQVPPGSQSSVKPTHNSRDGCVPLLTGTGLNAILPRGRRALSARKLPMAKKLSLQIDFPVEHARLLAHPRYSSAPYGTSYLRVDRPQEVAVSATLPHVFLRRAASPSAIHNGKGAWPTSGRWPFPNQPALCHRVSSVPSQPWPRYRPAPC